MGVEAARLACGPPTPPPTPCVRHGDAGVRRQDQRHHRPALRLPDSVPRSTSAHRCARWRRAALRLTGAGTTLAVSADLRTGLAGSADEAAGGDAAAALLVGDGDGVVAEYLGGASATRSSSIDGASQATSARSGRQVLEITYRSRPRRPSAGVGRHRPQPHGRRRRGRRHTHGPHRQGPRRQARRREGRRRPHRRRGRHRGRPARVLRRPRSSRPSPDR